MVANEGLQCCVVVLGMLAEALPQTRRGPVQRVVLLEIGVGAVLPCAGVDVGVIIAVRTDDQWTCATW